MDSLEAVIYERDLGNDETAILTLFPVLESDEHLARCKIHAKLHQHIEWRQGYGWFKQVTYVRGPCDYEWSQPLDEAFRDLGSLCDVRKSCWAELPRERVTMEMLRVGADGGKEQYETEEHEDCEHPYGLPCKHWGLE